MSPIEKSINDSKDRNRNSLWMMILKLFQFYVLSVFKRCLRPFYLSLGFYRTVHFVHADQIKLGFFSTKKFNQDSNMKRPSVN